MDVADFTFDLPAELIAQEAPAERAAARMLVVDRRTGARTDAQFTDFPQYLRPGDCLVVNDTRVLPARVYGHKVADAAGVAPNAAADANAVRARIELLLLEPLAAGCWTALARPGKRLRVGSAIRLEGPADAPLVRVVAKRPDGLVEVDLGAATDVPALLAQCGAMPLPPYIRRAAQAGDAERYQTVYACTPGAVAAPTAGLHFTPAVLAAVAARGVPVLPVTLHVGLGTFQPVSVARVADHVMHEERYVLPAATAAQVNATRRAGGRVVAVGTTAVRVLETCAGADGMVTCGEGRTRLFLHPPQQPRCVDVLLTNFHLPHSTLLMLVCTFAPPAQVLAAYAAAVQAGYRFFSYGDCMLLH